MNAGILEKLKKEYRSLLSGMGIGQKAANFIGLDMGSKYFRAVRVKKTGDEFLVQDKLIGAIEDISQLSSKMHLMDEEELSVNLNLEGIVIKRVSIPMMPQEEIESALKWELKEQVGFDIDKAKVKFNILGERETEDGAKKIELITFAYQESDVGPKVRQLKQISLNVQNIMPLDFALAKYVSSAKIAPFDEKVAIVDIGSIKTVISIIENSKVYFTREIPLGGDAITEAMTGAIMTEKGRMELSREDAEKMKKEYGIPSDIKILSMIRPVLERLVSQIHASLEYCENQYSCVVFKKIVLTGNGSKLKGLTEYLHREAGLEVVTILPEEAGAIGLALSRGFSMNMLPEEYRAEDKKALKRFSVTIVTFAMGVIVLFSYALLSMQAINLKKGVEIQKQHWDNLGEIKLLKDKIMAYSSVVNTVSLDGVRADRIMKEISNLILSDMALDRFTVDSKEPNIKISGVVSKQDSLTSFMSKLESNPLFQNVKLSFSEKNEALDGQDSVKFEITCNLRKK
ncbi:MAG: pilus assembly protein PilM [Candidatus Omnitrophica bacterium]|nr:pilus assembly protein PilM [Candidatus Omnitrophota bacterium]